MEQPYDPQTPKLDQTLLPAYAQYNDLDMGGSGIWSYLNVRGEYDLAAAFSKLFWPDFVEVDGCVLLKEHYSPDNYRHWEQALRRDRASIESMINHVHISDLFLNCDAVLAGDPNLDKLNIDPGQSNFGIYPSALLDYLGKVLLVCWKHALLEAFPGKRFAFYYTKDNDESAPEITFHQVELGAKPLGTIHV